MGFRGFHRIASVVVAAVVAVGLGLGVAYAIGTISPSSTNTYVGCVAPKTGALRIVSSPSQCLKTESVITLSGPLERTVSVNCGAGQSIQSAINSAPTSLRLIVDVSGVCHESVGIQGGQVAGLAPLHALNMQLVGVSPGAGITAPAGEPAIDVLGSVQLGIHKLTLSGGNVGVQAGSPGAVVVVGGDTITGATIGVQVSEEADVSIIGTTITNSGQSAVEVESGHADIGGTIDGSGGNGIQVGGSGTADVFGAVIKHAAGTGVYLYGGSAYLQSASVENNATGVRSDGGILSVLSGQVSANTGSGLDLLGGTRLTLDTEIVSNNGAEGIDLAGASVGSLHDDTVSGNVGDGIHLHDASVVSFEGGPNTQVSGNGYGIFCEGSPSDPLITGSSFSSTSNTGGNNNCTSAT